MVEWSGGFESHPADHFLGRGRSRASIPSTTLVNGQRVSLPPDGILNNFTLAMENGRGVAWNEKRRIRILIPGLKGLSSSPLQLPFGKWSMWSIQLASQTGRKGRGSRPTTGI